MGRRRGTQTAMAGVQAGAKVSGLTGGALSVGAGTGVAVGGSGLILALVLSLGGQVIDQKGQRRESLSEICQELTESPTTRARSGDAATVDASMEEQAKKVYWFWSAGMNDQNIAGCWQLPDRVRHRPDVDPEHLRRAVQGRAEEAEQDRCGWIRR